VDVDSLLASQTTAHQLYNSRIPSVLVHLQQIFLKENGLHESGSFDAVEDTARMELLRRRFNVGMFSEEIRPCEAVALIACCIFFSIFFNFIHFRLVSTSSHSHSQHR
jgi:hypothetical protein